MANFEDGQRIVWPCSFALAIFIMTIPGASSQEIVAEAVKIKSEIRVILTSAYSREMIERSINAPQIHGFIRKPFLLGDLVEIIRNCLSS